MQIIQSQNQYFEKVIRDKDGRLIRAKFFVYENAGRIKARLVDFVYLSEQVLINSANFLLSVTSRTKKIFHKFSDVYLETTNYNLDTIFSIGSKPRAPTF